jgi:hypothetical protein
MAQSGYTPIQLYYSTVPGGAPSAGNLASGELALNITDGKLFYKDNLGVVKTLITSTNVSTISFGSTGLTPSAATSGAVTVAGTLVVGNGGTGATTLTGVLKGNGTSAFTAAVAGTDYLAPPSGSAILKANSGGALANATAGTDYVAPGTATTFTALQTFNGSASSTAALFTNAKEKVTVSASSATSTINYDVLTQSVLYYTVNSSANWTLNIRGSATATLDSLMSNGECLTLVFMATNGATAYRQTALTIDGLAVTPKWQDGVTPSAGNVNAIDAYSVTVIKTATATFTALESITQFK